eukprot:CAMPEP_0114235188 /NCGR_PEP_ID=MMETSP0058-20121206/6112_1 /TAXON_ID=36894 /ORGANISM="Pyramimonas parkeae, CCMP726" /LENGTH=234 /DNA_ID=CAMNT_0001346923 /DNA_START=121 /DNA_END=825 /DNA_ORIENTATION=+
MFLLGVLRHLVTKLMKNTDLKVAEKSIRDAHSLKRAAALRTNSGYIPPASFRSKRAFFTHKETGLLNAKRDDTAVGPMGMPSGNQPMDPTMMVDMMKKNLSMVVPQMITYNWVTFFFSGFVVAKVPFALTMRFRGMLQRGIDLNSLDVTYVSSLSWYFLNLFGLRGVFTLVLGENSVDDYANMQEQMSTGMGAGADAGRAFKQEAENLDLIQHAWLLPFSERHCEKMLQEKLDN